MRCPGCPPFGPEATLSASGSVSSSLLVRCHQSARSPPLLYFYTVLSSLANLLHKNSDGEGFCMSPLPRTCRKPSLPLCPESAVGPICEAHTPAGLIRSQDGSTTCWGTGVGLGNVWAQVLDSASRGRGLARGSSHGLLLGGLVTLGRTARSVLSPVGALELARPGLHLVHLSGAVSSCSENPKPLGWVGGCHLLQSLFPHMCPRP